MNVRINESINEKLKVQISFLLNEFYPQNMIENKKITAKKD